MLCADTCMGGKTAVLVWGPCICVRDRGAFRDRALTSPLMGLSAPRRFTKWSRLSPRCCRAVVVSLAAAAMVPSLCMRSITCARNTPLHHHHQKPLRSVK